jgi:hypothetical protein
LNKIAERLSFASNIKELDETDDSMRFKISIFSVIIAPFIEHYFGICEKIVLILTFNFKALCLFNLCNKMLQIK